MFVSEAKKKAFSCLVEEHMSSAKLAKKREKQNQAVTRKNRRWKRERERERERERKTVSRWVIQKETITHHVAAAAAATVTPIRHQIVKSSLQITSRSSKHETHFSVSSYSYSSFSCCCRRRCCCKTRIPGAELVRFLEFQTPSSSNSPTRSFPRNSRPKLECCCFRAPFAHPLRSRDPRNFHGAGSSYAPTL